jgi:hypothetical protein
MLLINKNNLNKIVNRERKNNKKLIKKQNKNNKRKQSKL